jgi:hypothetical protein
MAVRLLRLQPILLKSLMGPNSEKQKVALFGLIQKELHHINFTSFG